MSERTSFDAVGDFHHKFGLTSVTHEGARPRPIGTELRDFRLKFIIEELQELCEGYGLELNWTLAPIKATCPACKNDFELSVGCSTCASTGYVDAQPQQDLPKIADALVDLSYVTLGTAHVHALPWQKLFDEVQRANITKERCGIDHRYVGNGVEACQHQNPDGLCGADRKAHSFRGSAYDVIKPEGWRAPDIIGVLMAAGWPGPPLPLKEE